MLPKIHRLAKKNDFDAVFNGGKKAKRGFLLFVACANNLPHSRFGFVVSKKVSTKATIRNTVRRRLRQAVAKNLSSISKPNDVVMVAMTGIEKQKFAEIELAIANYLQKL